MTRKFVIASLVLVLLGMESGCSTLTKDKGAKKDTPLQSLQFWKKGYQQPAKMVVLWSHDILTTAGQPPKRGFGGRIYFYNNKSQTIPVEGELVVHGFDESLKKMNGSPENQADKRFRFTQEQFTEHFSESDLGASYSVWIPWDAADGIQKEITLIPTFVSSLGEMVQGASAKVILPGRTGTQPGAQTPVQTVAYEQATIPTVEGPLPTFGAVPQTAPASGMRTTTIQVPNTPGRNKSALNGPTESTAPAQPPAMQAPGGAAGQNAHWVQARAQALADAMKLEEPVPQRPTQSFSAWTPNNVPLASTLATSITTVTPPNQSMTGVQPAHGGGQMGNQPQSTVVPASANMIVPPSQTQMQMAPRALQAVPFGHGASPSTSDETAGLPPGFQLTPRSTAWQ